MFKRNLLPFFVCFSFCPNGESKSVLIAQTHGQKVILYLPSVVPSFVYLLLNCLRRIDVVFRVIDCWDGRHSWKGAGALVSCQLDVPVGMHVNAAEAPEKRSFLPEPCLRHHPLLLQHPCWYDSTWKLFWQPSFLCCLYCQYWRIGPNLWVWAPSLGCRVSAPGEAAA